MEEAPIIRTCSAIAAIAIGIVATPALATSPNEADRLSTYVAARMANAAGNPDSSAKLLTDLVRVRPGDLELRLRAVSNAIEAGDMKLALQLGRGVSFEQAPLDLRMLLIADALNRKKYRDALTMMRTPGGTIDSTFLLPFVDAWIRAERGDSNAVASLNKVTDRSALARQVPEHRALVLLKLNRTVAARAFADMALGNAGGRADRLRLAFANGFQLAGDMEGAAKMLEGGGAALAVGQELLAAGKPIGQGITTPVEAFGEISLGLAVAVSQMRNKSLAVSLAQIARFANPRNSAADLLLGAMLDQVDRSQDALAILQRIGPEDPFATEARDTEIRILVGDDRNDLALRRAQELVAKRPSADSHSRLGAVLNEVGQYREAAEAYGEALAYAKSEGSSDELWLLHLLRAGALEEAGMWEESKAEVAAAMQIEPENALLLNFLGYGKLERGEDLDAAEAMVRKASALRPDDASITDSLGWAQFKRGKIDEAIETLQRASAGDPGQAEIREHLGDALYSAGRRIEARHAWKAALVTAEEDAVRKRLEAKIDSGLTKETAAP